MGAVYEAFDRERAEVVALKTLLHVTPDAFYLLKNEFRTLADVHHRNLIRLHELFVGESDRAFFSMELVSGTDIITHVRAAEGGELGARSGGDLIRPEGAMTSPPASGSGLSSCPTERILGALRADVPRLRQVLVQLVSGVQALHDAGKLHRDIKPSNVMVEDDGRVVLLDFGVATDVSRHPDRELGDDDQAVGTAHYMAPEQAFADEETTPAADWYGVGAVLYEALVGAPPFTGAVVEVLTSKASVDPLPPSMCVFGVPPDLDELCLALLQRDPRKRPSGGQILNRLGVRARATSERVPDPRNEPSPLTLFGRASHLAMLRAAFDDVRAGKVVTVRLRGKAGAGKSSLVQRFLDDLNQQGEAVVLRGRAYERESMPFKAVDSVMDALSRHLLWLGARADTPAHGIGTPSDTRSLQALVRLFPVLRRVPWLVTPEGESPEDPETLRRRAFAALRELLSSLASRRPLVLAVDDVQWGDTDSVALLLDLLRPPEAPPILLVLSYRAEEQEAPFIVELARRWPRAAPARDLEVGPLAREDAVALALRWIDDRGESARAMAFDIASEAGGSALLVEELARGVNRRRALGLSATEGDHRGLREGHAELMLDEVVRERLAKVPEGARAVLDLVAVGGRPLELNLVSDVVGAGRDVFTTLRESRFIRLGLRGGREVVEVVHDRIREAIVARLPPSVVRDHHARLARALTSLRSVDPEAVLTHLLGAGDLATAAPYAEQAAEHASAKLAFDQAGRLLQLRLDMGVTSPAHARPLLVRLAQMLAWAGRSHDAGRAYLRAAEGAGPEERAELERAAAAQLLAAGRIDEGALLLRQVVEAVGIKVPRTSVGAIFWLLVWRAWAALRGVRESDRTRAGVSASASSLGRARIEALHTAAIGYAIVDTLLAGCMQARHVLEALRRGDRFQLARAASIEVAFIAAGGKARGKHEASLAALAECLTDAGAAPEARAALFTGKGFAAFMRGDWRPAVTAFDAAGAELSTNLVGYQQNSNLFAAFGLIFLGELGEFEARQSALLADAERRGDLYTSVQLRVGSPTYLWLAADEPDTARAHALAAMKQWTNTRYLTQHWQVMYSETSIELYVGDGASAYARLERDARALKKTLLEQASGHLRVLTAFARGRAAVASIASLAGSDRPRRLAEAARLSGSLEREKLLYARVFAALLGASVARARGARDDAAVALVNAITLAEMASMPLYAASARFQLAGLRPGEEGRALLAEATRAMKARGVRVPARFAALIIPASGV